MLHSDFFGVTPVPSGASEEAMETTLGGWSISLALRLLVVGIAAIAASAQTESQQQELPDSPSAAISQRIVEARLLQEQTSSTASSAQPSPAEAQSSQQPSQPQSGTTQKPVGTAAAEAPAPVGIAASNPSGAAIAPAKQRRVRVFLIKVGAIVGAGVAVGTVAALSAGSPSRPPGSH